MHYVFLTNNLRLNYVEMLESVCLALEFGVHGINMVNKGNCNVKQSFDHSVTVRKCVPEV